MKFNYTPLFFSLIVTLLLIGVFPLQAAELTSLPELEAFLDGVFASQQREYNVPGITVAIIQDGEIILTKGYGYADLAKSAPIDPQTSLHRAGSNSKILVWMAVMQLVEQGKLDLYADINEYLDFSIPTTTTKGKEVPPLTLHHLMTHTAGFEDVVSGLFVSEPGALSSLREYVSTSLPGRIYPPGTITSYSNYGTSLAAYIVELVSGQPFAEYAEEHLFQPLAMTSSTFAQPLPPELGTQMSKGYYYRGGKYQAGEFEYLQPYPAGALTTTTTDMANLIIAQLQLGAFAESKVLSEESAKLMQTRQFTNNPQLPGVSYGFIETEVNGYQVLTHGGDTSYFHTGLYLLPTEQVGLYVTYNSREGTLARFPFFESFMDHYFPRVEESFKPRPIAAGTEDQYKGAFHSTRNNFTTPETWLRLIQANTLSVDQDGYLLFNANGNISRYGEISPGLFQATDGKGMLAVSFTDGQVSEIHFPGVDSYVRTPWHQTRDFIATILLLSLLIMLVCLIGWIKGIFKTQHTSRAFRLPKILGAIFILTCFTTLVLFVDAVFDFHPDLALPTMLLESSSALTTVQSLAKVVVGLGVILILMSLYVWIANKGNWWQKVYYSVLTFSAIGIVWVFWQVNFF